MPKWSWSSLSAGAVLGILLIAVFVVTVIPQVVAVVLTAPQQAGGGSGLSFIEVLGLWGESDPAAVTGAASGVLHWVIVAAVLAAAITLAVLVTVLVVRRARDPQLKKGLAGISAVNKEMGTTQLVRKRGPKLRPSLKSIKPADVGYRVGEFRGSDLWLRAEDPTIVIGPSRSGKGWYLVLNWILSAPGALITTSSKMDNAILTMKARESGGSRAWVFAPGVEGGESAGHVLRWSPVEGCIDEETLIRRVKALVPGDSFSGGTTNGGHWDTVGQQLAGDLFHAAACAGSGVDLIWEWVGSPQRASDAVRAIRDHEDGLREHADHLQAILDMPAEQRATMWNTLPTSLAFLESRSARKWMKPDPEADNNFDPVDFMLGKETLYLVGDKNVSAGYVRVIDGLLAELDHVSKGLADVSPGARLDPHVTYLLDEAGNFEYAGLYELITAGGGRGRVGIAVFQSKGQLTQWGEENAGTLWDAAVAKIILPGGGNQRELAEVSQLIGEEWVGRESRSYGSGPASVQVSEEKRSIIEASEIRELAGGYALVFYRNMKPVIAKLRGFDKNSRYKECTRNAAALTSKMNEASPYAARMREHLSRA